MGVSGNSVAGKGFQMFTVSEELLAKVTEAVQAGEKKARTSGDIQSFEVFCHGFRQNISLGRIYVVPPSVCSDRKNFPTALLYGSIVRIFGTGGEEVSDLVEKVIGESEFDEYSQADFDTIKEKLFVNPADEKEACLIVFAPNWINKREFIAFHFTKDSDQLKNNLRHQVFSAYYDPRVSSAFNALMTNVNTTKVDVTDITPKIPFPFLAENVLKEFPQLTKHAASKKATVLLNHKTADDVTKQTLEPAEMDVFDSLNQALENSLMPGTKSVGEAGEGGYTKPAEGEAVPRLAAAGDERFEANSEPQDIKGTTPVTAALKAKLAGSFPYDVFINDEWVNRIFYDEANAADDVKRSLISHDGYFSGIEVEPGGANIPHGDPWTEEEIQRGQRNPRRRPRFATSEKDEHGLAAHESPFTNVGPGTEAHDKQKDMVPAVKEQLTNDAEGDEPIGIELDETGVPVRKGTEKKAMNNRKRENIHPETLRVDPTRQSSAYSAAINGGFVDRHAMPPQSVRAYIEKNVVNNSGYSTAALNDHAKMVEAGAYGEDALNRRSVEKWGTAEVPVNFKRSVTAMTGDAFTDSYIETALWSSNDNATPQGGDPLDKNYGPEDLDQHTLAAMKADCDKFQQDNAQLLEQVYAGGTRDGNPAHCGHDFWLTRNGHGAGFWDSDYAMGREATPEGKQLGAALTKASKAFGTADLYVGDDKKIYQMGAEAGSNSPHAASYVASVMGKVVDSDGGYEAMSVKAKAARAKKESLLNKFRPKTAVELDIDSIWDAITEDFGPAPLVDVDSSSPTQNAEGKSDEAPEGNEAESRSDSRPRKSDLSALPESFTSDSPEDEKAMSDSEADAQEDSTPEADENFGGESKESAWQQDNKYADFVGEVYEDVNNEGNLTDQDLDAARQAIENEDQIIYDVAANAGQIVDNVSHMDWFVEAVAREMAEQNAATADFQEPAVQEQNFNEAGTDGDIHEANQDCEYVGDNDPAKMGSKIAGSQERIAELEQLVQAEKDRIFGGAEPRTDEMGQPVEDIATCGNCGESWNDALPTSHTPAPSGRCPFEYIHPELSELKRLKGKFGSKKKADTADNPANMTDGPGTLIRDRAVVSDTSGPTPVNTAKAAAKPKKADGGHAFGKCVECGVEAGKPHKSDCKVWNNSHAKTQHDELSKKKANPVQPDVAEAKSEVVSPDTVDKDIQQPTVSVEDAGKKAADVSGDFSEAKSELDYSKGDMADESKATDTVNPDHFAAAGEPGTEGQDRESYSDTQDRDSYTVSPELENDFVVENHGSIFMLTPISPEANAWAEENIPADAQKMGASIAVEHRYILDIIDGIENDGLSVKKASKRKKADKGTCSECGKARTLGANGMCHQCEQHEKDNQGSSKEAAYGDERSEEVAFDFGAGDLADIVMCEDEEGESQTKTSAKMCNRCHKKPAMDSYATCEGCHDESLSEAEKATGVQ